MANRTVLGCVEEVCRIAMGNNKPFGGKVIILLGDVHQTCPVIHSGTRVQIIDASIKSSPLWPLFTILRLNIPIRNVEDPEFSAFVDSIGDGSHFEIPLDMCETMSNQDDIIDFVYPSHTLTDPTSCLRRAILCPTNAQVDVYNDIITSKVEGIQCTYLAADTLQEANETGLTPPDGILDYFSIHTPPVLKTRSTSTDCTAGTFDHISVD